MSSGDSDSDSAGGSIEEAWGSRPAAPPPTRLGAARPARITKRRENARRRREIYRDPDGAPLMQRDGNGRLEVVGSEFSVPYSAVDASARMLAQNYRYRLPTVSEAPAIEETSDEEEVPARGPAQLELGEFLQSGTNVELGSIMETCAAAEGAVALLRQLDAADEAKPDLLNGLYFLKAALTNAIENTTGLEEGEIGRIIMVIDEIDGRGD